MEEGRPQRPLRSTSAKNHSAIYTIYCLAPVPDKELRRSPINLSDLRKRGVMAHSYETSTKKTFFGICALTAMSLITENDDAKNADANTLFCRNWRRFEWLLHLFWRQSQRQKRDHDTLTPRVNEPSRVFHMRTEMPILAFSSLLHEYKKNSSDKMSPPVGIAIASDSKSNTLLSTLHWHVLLRRSLNFCSSTTWYLDLDGIRGINRAWPYKDPKVSVLQANVKLV